MSESRVAPTDTAVRPGDGRHYYRDVVVRRCDDGALALRVYGHIACAIDTSVQQVLAKLLDAHDPDGLVDGDVVATLRLVPRAKHVEVVHERGEKR